MDPDESGWPRRGCAFSHAAQLRNAFGDEIHVFAHLFINFVEKLVQPDEMRALDVPVRLLGLGWEKVNTLIANRPVILSAP